MTERTSFLSDIEVIHRALKRKSIQCVILSNRSCVNCDAVDRKMVVVGSFVMCVECWTLEFNMNEIPLNSVYYEKYQRWTKRAREKEEFEITEGEKG